MKYTYGRKTISIIIIVMFFSISFIPYTYGKISYSQFINIEKKFYNNSKSYLIINNFNNLNYKEILVKKYNSDGSIEKYIVKISDENFEKFFDELKRKDSLKEKFEVYKKYSLVPKDSTYEQLKKEIQNNEKYLDLNPKLINKLNKGASFHNKNNNLIMSVNSQCEVNGIINYGIKYLIGMSAITSFINFILWHNFNHIPSADLLDLYAADWGKLDAVNGTMSDFHTEYGFLLIIMVGFVGYTFAYPPIPGNILVGEFFGKALIVLCQH